MIPPAPAYLYTNKYFSFDYGLTHPLRIWRLELANALIRSCGLAQSSIEVYPASYEDLLLFHDKDYLKALQDASRFSFKNSQLASFGLGTEDNPIFSGVFEWSSLLAGASLQAGRLVVVKKHAAAFNMAGGMHHASMARASGFCYINDICLVIKELLSGGYRVVYVDIDVHHGDGVQHAFYDNNQVLTISLHQHPATLFPGTGNYEEIGCGIGKGYAINMPLLPDTDDDIYIRCFDEIVPPLIEAFKPDYFVTQLGVDTFITDPLANLNLTTWSFGHCLKRFRELAMGRWIAVGGGGYDVINVARGWTLAWATILGRESELPQDFPLDWCKQYKISCKNRWLLYPKEKLIRRDKWHYADQNAKDVIKYIQKNIFPIHSAKRG